MRSFPSIEMAIVSEKNDPQPIQLEVGIPSGCRTFHQNPQRRGLIKRVEEVLDDMHICISIYVYVLCL